MYSLVYNQITISNMLRQGYSQVYDYTYDHATTLTELSSILSNCRFNSILCVGGSSVSSDVMLLVSCGDCQSILTQTSLNNPTLINGAYWYMTSDKSFGFSDSSTISQNSCDTEGGNFRICWHLSGGSGGYRLGSLTGLNSEKNYRKLIFVYYNPITFIQYGTTTTTTSTTTSTSTTSTTTMSTTTSSTTTSTTTSSTTTVPIGLGYLHY